jgi:hypothetical protein
VRASRPRPSRASPPPFPTFHLSPPRPPQPGPGQPLLDRGPQRHRQVDAAGPHRRHPGAHARPHLPQPQGPAGRVFAAPRRRPRPGAHAAALHRKVLPRRQGPAAPVAPGVVRGGRGAGGAAHVHAVGGAEEPGGAGKGARLGLSVGGEGGGVGVWGVGGGGVETEHTPCVCVCVCVWAAGRDATLAAPLPQNPRCCARAVVSWFALSLTNTAPLVPPPPPAPPTNR